jgi:CheY-like chemotaxis protein
MALPTVLIADDDRVFVEVVGSKLRARGLQVLNAFDVMQAVMIANKSIPDAIVLDVMMPGGTGLEAIKRFKLSSKTCGIPIIAVSASDDPNLPDLVKVMGAVGFLHKPVNVDSIYKLLSYVLSLDSPAPVRR